MKPIAHRTAQFTLALTLLFSSSLYASFDGAIVDIRAENSLNLDPIFYCRSASLSGVAVGPDLELTGDDWTASGTCVGVYEMDISGDSITLTSNVQYGNYRYAEFQINIVSGDPITDFCFVGYSGNFFETTRTLNDETFFPTVTFGDSFVRAVWNTGTFDEQFAFWYEGGTATFSTVCGNPPIADAGDDEFLLMLGEVTLNGSNSFDPDGDPISYFWVLSTPPGSTATLSDPTAVHPQFVADVYGDYIATLVVTDAGGLESAPDSVTVGFSNLAPTADAGLNQAVLVGTTATLDGTASADPNMDTLSYSWTFLSRPSGSSATLIGAASSSPSFVADQSGDYLIQLVVSDGRLDSSPDTVVVAAIALEDALTRNLLDLLAAIRTLSETDFTNRNMQNALINQVLAALRMIEAGDYHGALSKLTNDVLGKTDGCATSGAADSTDWIDSCTSQGVIYPLAVAAIDLLARLE